MNTHSVSARRDTGPDLAADLAGVRVGKTSSLGTGGMASKLAAADLASGAGVPVLVAAAADAPAALETVVNTAGGTASSRNRDSLRIGPTHSARPTCCPQRPASRSGSRTHAPGTSR